MGLRRGYIGALSGLYIGICRVEGVGFGGVGFRVRRLAL